jgi:predicted RNA-binding protein YlxR (DUF448 family)
VTTCRPHRTCIGCRAVRPQADLLRLARSAEGRVEPDPGRRGGGRGAYVCRSERCLGEAVRRSRWAQVFRAPAVLGPEAAERVRVLLQGTGEGKGATDSPAARSGKSVKGGC